MDGLSKFVALGTLNLHSNNIDWLEFERIRHLHIVDLITVNNPKLSNDPNCLCFYSYFYLKQSFLRFLLNYVKDRNHVIDCLPNVWMVDGLLVTSTVYQPLFKMYLLCFLLIFCLFVFF